MTKQTASLIAVALAEEAAENLRKPVFRSDDRGGFTVLTLDLSATTTVKDLPDCKGVLFLAPPSPSPSTVTFRSGGQSLTLYPGDQVRGNYSRAQVVAASGSGTATLIVFLEDRTVIQSGTVQTVVTGGVSPTSSSFAAGAVQVLTTATLISDGLTDRRALFVQNLGPNAIWLGASGVTTATGIKVEPNGGTLTLPIQAGTAIYAIASTANQASPADTRYMATN